MLRKRAVVLLSALVIMAPLAGCDFGKVTQGRVVGYDKEKGLITIIPEQWDGRSKRDTYVLPPLIVKAPADPKEMGPVPRSGRLLSVDSKRHELTYFDPAQSSMRTIAWQPITEQSGVFADDPRVSSVAIPAIDRKAGSLTLYSPKDRKLLEIAVAAEYLELPVDTWRAGDDVRYYYKDPRQALRLMNVSRTDMTKGGH